MPIPKSPQKTPYILKVEPGTYAWCSCGESLRQPFCDGSHSEGTFSPFIEKVVTAKTIAWCGCKFSGKPPFCDGSHSTR